MKTREPITEVESPSVGVRVQWADTPLHSVNPTEADVDAEWCRVARMRLDELRSGQVEPVPGAVVFERIGRLYRNAFQSVAPDFPAGAPP